MNAHFNFAKLGGVADEYAANFYGESTSALHRGHADRPAGRAVADREPHVVRRLEQPPELRVRAQEVGEAPVVNTTAMDGKWRDGEGASTSRSKRGACGSRSRPGSPRCSRRRRTARCSGACTCGRCSRTYFARAIARSISCCSGERRLRALPAGGPLRIDLERPWPYSPPTPAARSSCARRARAGGCETPSGLPAHCS